MTSQNKKNKARNSYFYNGAEKITDKMKRRLYYNKRLRKKINKEGIETSSEYPYREE